MQDDELVCLMALVLKHSSNWNFNKILEWLFKNVDFPVPPKYLVSHKSWNIFIYYEYVEHKFSTLSRILQFFVSLLIWIKSTLNSQNVRCHGCTVFIYFEAWNIVLQPQCSHYRLQATPMWPQDSASSKTVV